MSSPENSAETTQPIPPHIIAEAARQPIAEHGAFHGDLAEQTEVPKPYELPIDPETGRREKAVSLRHESGEAALAQPAPKKGAEQVRWIETLNKGEFKLSPGQVSQLAPEARDLYARKAAEAADAQTRTEAAQAAVSEAHNTANTSEPQGTERPSPEAPKPSGIPAVDKNGNPMVLEHDDHKRLQAIAETIAKEPLGSHAWAKAYDELYKVGDSIGLDDNAVNAYARTAKRAVEQQAPAAESQAPPKPAAEAQLPPEPPVEQTTPIDMSEISHNDMALLDSLAHKANNSKSDDDWGNFFKVYDSLDPRQQARYKRDGLYEWEDAPAPEPAVEKTDRFLPVIGDKDSPDVARAKNEARENELMDRLDTLSKNARRARKAGNEAEAQEHEAELNEILYRASKTNAEGAQFAEEYRAVARVTHSGKDRQKIFDHLDALYKQSNDKDASEQDRLTATQLARGLYGHLPPSLRTQYAKVGQNAAGIIEMTQAEKFDLLDVLAREQVEFGGKNESGEKVDWSEFYDTYRNDLSDSERAVYASRLSKIFDEGTKTPGLLTPWRVFTPKNRRSSAALEKLLTYQREYEGSRVDISPEDDIEDRETFNALYNAELKKGPKKWDKDIVGNKRDRKHMDRLREVDPDGKVVVPLPKRVQKRVDKLLSDARPLLGNPKVSTEIQLEIAAAMNKLRNADQYDVGELFDNALSRRIRQLQAPKEGKEAAKQPTPDMAGSYLKTLIARARDEASR